MKSTLIITLLLLSFQLVFSQDDSIQARIVVIGDAGALINGKHPVVSAVKHNMKLDKKTLVLYVGDNLYKEGLPDDQTLGYADAKAILDSQINVIKGTGARIVFIPGNHDWNNGGVHGYEAVLREEQYINILADNNVRFLPGSGCPGPVEVKINDDVTLVVMDSQWWLHESDKPGVESDCPCKTQDEVLVQLEDILNKNAKKLVIFACHHPFKSYGIHGGYYTWKQHLFPFTDMKSNLYIPVPLLGSIYPITRGIFGTTEDLPHPLYQNMVNAVNKVLKTHSNIIHVSGHEHSMQLIKDSSRYFIVSGSGCKQTRVSKGKNTMYKEQALGFATLEVSKNKNVSVDFYTVDATTEVPNKSFSSALMNFSALPDNSADTVTKATVVVARDFEDSITVAPNTKFDDAGSLKRLILGKNYRKDWATPIKIKVFDITKEKGGLTIKSLGGGKQTKSLTLEDKKGRQWVLRTINKDPSKAIPENFRNSLAEDIAQDFISGSYPYAPLIVSPLADTLKIIAPKPEIFYVPDDPAFGYYQKIFAKQVVMLEQKDPTPDNTDTKSSFTVFDKMIEDNDNRVDQKVVLKARLLDMLVADWDRHLDQWKFGVADTGKGKLYYAIPKDRDQAMYYSDGLIVKMVSQNLLPFFKGFQRKIPKIAWLNWSARDFDRLFLNQMNWSDWEEAIKEIQNTLTDNVIAYAVSKVPPEVFAINGTTIIEKLKGRRNVLLNRAKDYYEFLSDQVNVLGSNENEYFKITESGKGFHLKVFKRSDKSDSTSVMYDRVFGPRETDEVHLYGFNGNDVFDIDENVRSRVRIRIIGGKGNDTFNLKGEVSSFVYDVSYDSNYVVNRNRSKIRINDDPQNNSYKISGFQYNVTRLPTFNVAYNAEDKFMAGIGFTRKVYGFRKEPYSSYQKLTTLYAMSRHAYKINYTGEFNQVLGNTDIVFNAQLTEPVLNNFFGLGNGTTSDKDREFYRVRYNYFSADVLFRKRKNEILHLGIGPAYFLYWNHPEDNAGKILAKPSLIGLDSIEVYSSKRYLGGRANIFVDFVDNSFLPTRGIIWNTDFICYGALTKSATPLTRLTSDMTVYGSIQAPAKVVGVLKLGGGHIFSDKFEYFQALNLGQNNFLRGFRKNRFSGKSLAYGSLEMRIKLFRSKSYIIPGDVGIVGFAETGRVWMPGEDSKTWHSSYGTGLYYTPFNLVIVSATVAFSKEERLFNFSLGTKFNLTF
jgi:hypothetical protein